MRVFPSQHPSTNEFYREAVDTLQDASIEFLVGGAFAMRCYTGIDRDTKDFDLMIRPGDVDRALAAFRSSGLRADYAFTHWLAKIHRGEYFIDMVFRAGNGLCEVDDLWFAHGREYQVLDRNLRLCPPEEMIWQKSYIMERERFDGADVQHLLLSCGPDLDWDRLLGRFESDWRVLLSHLVLFQFVYPAEKCIPSAIMHRLTEQLGSDTESAGSDTRLCCGPLLSRAQYLPDVERWNYVDARSRDPRVRMTQEERHAWTNAIDSELRP